jgi:hypothetical protein
MFFQPKHSPSEAVDLPGRLLVNTINCENFGPISSYMRGSNQSPETKNRICLLIQCH